MKFFVVTIILFFVGVMIVNAADEDIKNTEKTEKKGLKIEVSDTKELLEAVKKVTSEGGIINLAPGEYIIEEPIVFKDISGLVIAGSGWNTKIIRKGDGDAIVFDGKCWNNVVKDLSIEGDKTAAKGSGIVFQNGEWNGICMVDYCFIKNFPESGIKFDGNKKTPFSSNTVSRCWLIENKGYQIYSLANNDFYFVQNQIGTGGTSPIAGCMLKNSSAGTYSMNYHWGNTVGLVVGENSSYNRIENNRFEESREAGLQIGEKGGDGNYFTIITGNTIHTNSEHSYGIYNAIEGFNSHSTIFTQNQVFSWWSPGQATRNGLVLDEGCTEWIIKDNHFYHHTEKPIIANANGKHIIKDNIFGDKLPDKPTAK